MLVWWSVGSSLNDAMASGAPFFISQKPYGGFGNGSCRWSGVAGLEGGDWQVSCRGGCLVAGNVAVKVWSGVSIVAGGDYGAW